MRPEFSVVVVVAKVNVRSPAAPASAEDSAAMNATAQKATRRRSRKERAIRAASLPPRRPRCPASE